MPNFPDTPLAAKIAALIEKSELQGVYTNADGKKCALPSLIFRRYMEACLYDEQYGYYCMGTAKVGKAGDFYTSSAIGDIMGQMIARYARRYSQSVEVPVSIAEWGAGTGRLSAHIAAACHRLKSDSWFRQLLIENHPGHAAETVHSFRSTGLSDSPPVVSSERFLSDYRQWIIERPLLLIANELLDAFPVHRVTRRGGELHELGVTVLPEQQFAYTLMPLSDPQFEQWLSRDGITLREGQVTEVCPDAREWILLLGALIGSGQIMIIDYGHDAAEYAAEHRMEGTLMTYSNHRGSDSPFDGAGERDITAHVSFDFIRTSAEEAGFDIIYYATQKQFLIEQGVFDLLSNHDGSNPFSEQAKQNRAIRQLLLSDGMSESFKVMILEKKTSP